MEEYNVTFVHPTTGAILTALVNPDLTADEAIQALVAEKFLDTPNELVYYGLALENGSILEGTQSLSDGGVGDWESLTVVELLGFDTRKCNITCIHPITDATIDVEINSDQSADDIIGILIAVNFICPPNFQQKYGFEFNRKKISGFNSLYYSLGLSDGSMVNITIEKYCNITFINTTTGGTFADLINLNMTAEELIVRLTSKGFISFPDYYHDYSFKFKNGTVVKGKQKLSSIQFENDIKVRVLLESYDLTFIHPISDESLTVRINPNLRVDQVIHMLNTVMFIDRPNIHHDYLLQSKDGTIVKRGQALSDITILDNDSVKILLESYCLTFIHPVTEVPMDVQVNPNASTYEVISFLIKTNFLLNDAGSEHRYEFRSATGDLIYDFRQVKDGDTINIASVSIN